MSVWLVTSRTLLKSLNIYTFSQAWELEGSDKLFAEEIDVGEAPSGLGLGLWLGLGVEVGATGGQP